MASQNLSARTPGRNIGQLNCGNVTYTCSGNSHVGVSNQQPHELVEWVSDQDFSLQQSQALERCTNGTLLWALKEPELIAWLERVGILWCQGKPGAGKTVFASFIVDHLQKHSAFTPKPVVCYVYCRYGSTFSPLQLFSAILRQYLVQVPSPHKIIERIRLKKDRKESLTLDDILSMLKESLLTTPNVFIVLDALDECFDQQNQRLVLLHLQQLTSVHILITSRHLPSIENARERVATLRISAHGRDIRTHLAVKTQSNPRFRRILPKDRRTDVEAKLIGKADGIFLLAHLHVEDLVRQMNTADLLRVVEDLPTAAMQIYKATLRRIQEQDENERRLAFQALSWVLHAPCSLNVTELRHALATHLGRKAANDELTDEEKIISSCAGLIVTNRVNKSLQNDETVVVSFLHRTVQEFLENASCTTYADMLSDIQIALRCMKVISFPGIHCNTSDYPFFKYAASAWGSLVQQHESDEEVRQLALSQLGDTFSIRALGAIWQDDDDDDDDDEPPPTALHHIARFGLICTCEAFLRENHAYTKALINKRTRNGRTALLWAARTGHSAVLEQFLAIPNIEVNSSDPLFSRTPLSWAAANGHSGVVQALLRHQGINTNSMDTNLGQTPLSWGARNGHLEVVQVLLRHPGVDVNSKDTYFGQTPLSWAAEYGHIEVVRELLRDPSIDMNSRSSSSQTPLSYAAKKGRLGVVQELLRHPDVQFDCSDINGQTPLSLAAEHGHPGVLRELLQHPRSDVNSKDINLRTPLSWAARNGCLSVVNELLRHAKIDVNSPDHLGRTPLFYAAKCGRSAIVRQLVEHPDIIINLQDPSRHLTPLIWGTMCRPSDSCEVLLVVDLLIQTSKFLVPGKRRFSSAGSAKKRDKPSTEDITLIARKKARVGSVSRLVEEMEIAM